MNKINVLILCSSGTVYTVQLIKYTKKYCPNIEFSLLTYDCNRDFYEEKLKKEEYHKIYDFSRKSVWDGITLYIKIKELPSFDVIHSLWMERHWGRFAFLLRKKCTGWLSSVGGSDLYRETQKLRTRYLQRLLLAKADWFSSETEETRQYFNKMYGSRFPSIPHSINNFGIDILDEITEEKKRKKAQIKNEWNIKEDKIIIVCGHNAHAEHNHLKMIHAIKEMPLEILEKCFFIFPMTYPSGREEYIQKIKENLEEVTHDYIILTDFMNTVQMAEYIVASDVMIHVRTTDQLSSTMLAHMYNGNVVIAGSWLPYASLKRQGIYFLEIDKISELSNCLTEVCSDLTKYKERCKNNAEKVYAMSSWKVAAEKWEEIYIKLAKGQEGK